MTGSRAQLGTINARPGRPYVVYRPELDSLRGVAVILVFLQHAQLTIFGNSGAIGVTIFFTLSGFLITSLLVGEREATGLVDLPRFYWHRGLRLLPAVTVLVAVVLVLGAVTGQSMVLQSAAVMTYIGNWADIAGLNMWVLGHTWSLAIEEQFYLAWPALLLVLPSRRAQLIACVVGVVVAIGLRAAVFDPAPDAIWRYYQGTDTRADALLIGCALALIGKSAPRWVGLLGAAALVAVVALVQDDHMLASIGLPATAVATALLIAGRTPLTWRPLIALGGISYGFYLWHFPVIGLTRPYIGGLSGPLVVAGWFVVTLACAVASRRLIELPMLKLRNGPVVRPWIRGRVAALRTDG